MAFLVTISSSGRYLSCNQSVERCDVDSWTSDDSSGRQRWELVPSGQADTYFVKVSKGRDGPKVFMTAGSTVFLEEKNGGPAQQWIFKALNKARRIFTVQCGSDKFVTFDLKSSKVTLGPRLAQGQGAASQQFYVAELERKADTKVFVGGAFKPTQHDLAHDAGNWATVAPRVGYWLHPMGMAVAQNEGWLPLLLSRFGTKKFVYEQDLLAWSDGTNPLQSQTPSCWGDWLRQANPQFTCEFYAPWVAGDRLANLLDDTTNRYAQIRQKMDAAGYANLGFFFYAPPCPESIVNADALLNNKVNGSCHVEHVVKTAGLRGIAIDYPASLWLASHFPAQFPEGSAEKCRKLAKQAHDVARALHLPFCWVFNGSDVNVTEALKSIAAAGMTLDYACVDNFANADRRGTPETDPKSVTGQARNILQSL